MTSLRNWRQVIAFSLSKGLGFEELGYKMPVYPYQPTIVEHMPCVVIQAGSDTDDYRRAPNATEGGSGFCTYVVSWGLGIFGGQPYDPQSQDIIDDVVERIDTAIKLCLDDDLNDTGQYPRVGPISPARVFAFEDGSAALGCIGQLSLPIHFS